MNQLPVSIKEWTILPLAVLSLIVLVYTGVWAADKLGLSKRAKTFAEEGELYWDKLRLVIREEINASHNRHNRT